MMKHLVNFIGLLIAFLLFSSLQNPPVYTVKLKMSNIRNTEGRIQLQFYKDEKTFKAEKPYKIVYIPKTDVQSKYMESVIHVEEGIWGFAFLDDENSNGKMDYGILPKEGFGFANFYHSGWSRPKFDDFKVTVRENTFVTVKFRYL